MNSTLEVHKDELLPAVLDKTYEVYYFSIFCFSFLFSAFLCNQLMELAPHIPIERCRLVKYDYDDDLMGQSFDLDEV